MAFDTVFEEVYISDILFSAIATDIPPIKVHTIVMTLEAGFVFISVPTFITFVFQWLDFDFLTALLVTTL